MTARNTIGDPGRTRGLLDFTDRVVLTALVFLAIQLEGNFLTPRIQGQAIEVPSNEHTCNNNPNTDLDGTVVCESKASSRVETPDPELT
ncbi:MAG: hypothetical protein ACXW3X_16415 [Rhodoplanes sp.]